MQCAVHDRFSGKAAMREQGREHKRDRKRACHRNGGNAQAQKQGLDLGGRKHGGRVLRRGGHPAEKTQASFSMAGLAAPCLTGGVCALPCPAMGIRGDRMRKIAAVLAVGAFSGVLLGAAEELPPPAPLLRPGGVSGPDTPPAAPGTMPPQVAGNPSIYVIRYDRWTQADDRGFGEFVTALGNTNCRTVNDCLHSPANPFRASDPEGIYFHSDCADLPYVLRAYYAWKRGLPFSYVSAVTPRGHARDIRYSKNGNEVVERRD